MYVPSFHLSPNFTAHTKTHQAIPNALPQVRNPYQASQLQIEHNFQILQEARQQWQLPTPHKQKRKKRHVPITQLQNQQSPQTTTHPPDISKIENSNMAFQGIPPCLTLRDCVKNPNKQYTVYNCSADGFSTTCRKASCRSVIAAARDSEGVTKCIP